MRYPEIPRRVWWSLDREARRWLLADLRRLPSQRIRYPPHVAYDKKFEKHRARQPEAAT
jgi:glucose-6-phosphate dehydrogenase assembly protein OpcA